MADVPIHVFGVELSLLTALCASGQALLARVGSQYGGVREGVLLNMLVNAVIFLPAALLIEYPDYGLTPVSVVAFASSGLGGTLLGRLFYFVSIKRIGAGRAEPLKDSMPLFATTVAVLILGE